MRTLRSARGGARLIALIVLGSVLSACTQLADVLTPGERGSTAAPATLSLNASIAGAQLSPADAVNLSVVVSYLRQGGARVRLASLSRPLGNATLQSVPIGIDVAACLADPEREGGEGSCVAVLQLALSVNGVVVDEQLIGPLRLTPGQPTNVPGAVTLFDIAGIEVLDADGRAVPVDAALALTLGEARKLQAVVRDTRGALIAERVPTWSSDAPAVAAITASGDITAVSVGTARFVATLGQRSVALSANVVRPTVALEITAAAGSGSGVVRSTPAGIDCRIERGAISGQCSFAFDVGANVTLQSTADSDNLFAAWGRECAASEDNNTCTLSLDRARQATAQFTALRRLTISALPAGSGRGRIAGNGTGLDCLIDGASVSGTCSVQLPDGAEVRLTAAPEHAGNETPPPRFLGWSDVCSEADATTCVVALEGDDRVITTAFVAQRLLSVDVAQSGNGVVRSFPTGIECRVAQGVVSGTCSVVFDANIDVTLQSIPDDNNLFTSWGESCASSENRNACVITSGQSGKVSARFTALRRVTISASALVSGRGRVTGSNGLDCLFIGSNTSGICSVQVPDGTTVTLTAVREAAEGGSSSGTEFSGWGAGCSVTTLSTCVFTVSGADKVVSTGFVSERRLTVSVSGTGTGVVRAGRDVECVRGAGGATSGTCQATYSNGAQVTLQAQADEGSEFVGFSGDCASVSGPTCTVSMTSSRTVSATFARRRAILTLILDGNRVSAGTVSVNGDEACSIALGDASRTCARGFDAGAQVVTVSVRPENQSVFTGFAGDCSGTGTCTLTMSANRTVRVNFAAAPRAVNLVRSASASGSGRVQSVDVSQRIDCAYTEGEPGATGCRTTVPAATTVRLVATPNAASALLSWGDACAGTMTLTCVLSPSAAVTDVSARFGSAIDVQLLVSGGAGSIAFDVPNVPSQGTCASTASTSNSCRFSLPVGTTGVFRATPAAGVRFSGFRGPCLEGTGLVPTCTYRGFGFVRQINAYFGDPP